MQTSAQNTIMLIIGRVVAGVGVGITSSAGPAFISEVAPEKIRGMLVGIYQNNVCLAIVAAAVLNYAVHDATWGWRLSLGLQVAPGPHLEKRLQMTSTSLKNVDIKNCKNHSNYSRKSL